MAKRKELRRVASDYYSDLTLLVRPEVADFTQPSRTIQWAYRTSAILGYRLRRSRAKVVELEAIQEEVLKKPLRAMFQHGPVAGVIRDSRHGGRVWVTQPMSTVPSDPLKLLKWLGKDSLRVIKGVEIDPLIITKPLVIGKIIRSVTSQIGQEVDFPVRLKVDRTALQNVVAEREDDDTDPESFFTPVGKGSPTVYTKPD